MDRKKPEFFASGKILTLCVVSLLAMPQSAHAALKENESTYREFRAELVVPADEPKVLVVKQDLTEFLAIAGKFNGYKVEFSNEISGILENNSLPMNIQELMQKLGKMFDLKWHIQPSRIFVSMGSEREERVLDLNGIDIDRLKAAIRETGIGSDEFEMKFLQDRDAFIVTGPASYLDGIAEIAEELNGSENTHE